jgi:acyl-CoA dehydrogenase
MYRYLFNRFKKIIPKISETEIIALRSGGTSIDRDIFKGKIDYQKLFKNPVINQDLPIEINDNINKLLQLAGQTPMYPNKNINEIMSFLGKNGFLSMIIDKKYGGNRLPIETQSQILTKISSYNPSLGVSTMVPNSLGPAELLQHYGTDIQKQYFLPKLANGSMIPCFGLTGPNNGSDAIGSIDKGTVVLKEGKIMINLTLDKRYITLAPISNLIGIAFNLEDPNHLLKNKKSGITVALIESSQIGLKQLTYHNPNNAGFPNGTIKGSIVLELSQVIGGEERIGDGWKMLMECLAVGRGVSLPAASSGSSKFITQSILNYINIRKQFNLNIGNMEAVREKFIDMYLNTWIIHTSIKLTNHILDNGSTPSVITAIMKQQTTERARNILNHGMDIYAGSGICTGENNFITAFYNSAPVGITVEGSNTLTRGLIIFGQGLNKSHSYIFPIFENIQNNDLVNFKKNINNLLYEIIKNYVTILNPFFNQKDKLMVRLEKATIKFSLLSNFVALLGGKIKSKQMISGNMSDILSNLYLSYSLVWYHHHNNSNDTIFLKNECIDYLLNELEYKMNLVIDNYPISLLKPVLFPLKNKIIYPKFENKNELYNLICNNKQLNEIFRNDIYYKGTVLEKMELLNNSIKGTKEYEKLYQDIIKVGEYQIK